MIACALGRAPGENFDAARMTRLLADMLPVLGCTLAISGNWPGVDRCLAEAALLAHVPYMIVESHIVGTKHMPLEEVKRITHLEENAFSFLRLGVFKDQAAIDTGNAYRIRHSDAVFTWLPGPSLDAARVLGKFPLKARIDMVPLYGG